MKLRNKIILFSSIFILILFTFIGTIKEGLQTTLAQEYSKQSIADTSGNFIGTGNQLTTNISDMNYSFAPTEASFNELTSYKTNNYDIEYHDPVDVIQKTSNKSGTKFGEAIVYDPSGKKFVVLPKSEQQGTAIYYNPGAFPFGSKTYVPNYEEGVYLSRSNKLIS